MHRLSLQHRPHQLRQVHLGHQSGKGCAGVRGLGGLSCRAGGFASVTGLSAPSHLTPPQRTGESRQFPMVLEIVLGVISFGAKDICFSLSHWKTYSALPTGTALGAAVSAEYKRGFTLLHILSYFSAHCPTHISLKCYFSFIGHSKSH